MQRTPWILIFPADLSAAAAIINYWDSSTSPAVWISVGLVIVIGINTLGVGKHLFCNSIVFLTIRRRCIWRSRILVQVNPNVRLPSVIPLTDLSLAQ